MGLEPTHATALRDLRVTTVKLVQNLVHLESHVLLPLIHHWLWLVLIPKRLTDFVSKYVPSLSWFTFRGLAVF